MIVVDASAIVAILTGEPEDAALIAMLERAESALTSPIAIYEAALGVRRKRHSSVAEAENDVMEFLAAARIGVAAIEPTAAGGALEAFARYGKGTQHPAQLNMGDCFAYGQAKALNAQLLFKGADFSMTDIEAAH
ncbi:MAG: type II toxin-antitoxin system VapC family toxin [Roseiarcus sp.]|jgi:ribonuclease VapC